MTEQQMRMMIEAVRGGHLSRRGFTRHVAPWGLTAPMVTQLLALAGAAPAAAQSAQPYRPTRRGGGGALKILYWQAATLLNPHFAVGTTNTDASRVFYEPLAAWAQDATLVPILAAEIPSLENGGLSPDGRSVTWKLKPGTRWHDGAPVTADDLLFNWEFSRNPAVATTTSGSYRDVGIVKLDALSVRLDFAQPTAFWADAFVGSAGMIIPRHIFGAFNGANARDAPGNFRPVGTGPYRFVSFTPGDMLRAELNPLYHMENRPHFDTLEIKGGGDAVSAARAVLQTADYDYAWNLLVEDDILTRLEAVGRGRVEVTPGGSTEFIQLNVTDPNREVEGERSSIATTHPAFSDPAVRQAMAMLIDRASIERFIFGRAGKATANILNNSRFTSPHAGLNFSIQRANEVLDAAGWARGRDGIRAKGATRLKFLFQTSVNAPRQRSQAVIKQAAQRAGIELDLKGVTASVFFSADIANPDTFSKFYADMQMYANGPSGDPQRYMSQFASWEIASRANAWQGRNIMRWQNAEYDAALRAADVELDPVKRVSLFIRLNDLVVGSNHLIPLLARPGLSGALNNLRTARSGWDSTLAFLSEWWREA